jgi:hypothetical protein
MMRRLWRLCLLSLAASLCAHGNAAENSVPQRTCEGAGGYERVSGSRTFLWRPQWLAIEKKQLARDSTAANALQKAADAALTRGPYSVTGKGQIPESGDRHDYYSIGPYWWPDASKADGLPYVRRDGETNPESRGPEFDKDRVQRFASDVELLALAAHHLGDRRYAEHVAALLRAWFLDPATRMNPNLNFAQAVPGINAGRGEGIIELIVMPQVVESIGLVAAQGALTPKEVDELKAWFGAFAAWMQTSANGKDEAAKSNNHGLYYDYLLTHFALFAGKEELAKSVASGFLSKRIAAQMAKDGSLPEELSRTRSLHYSFFAMQAATRMATISECVGVDIWRAETADGRGLEKGLDYLAAFLPDWKGWPHPESAFGDAKKTTALGRLAAEPLRLMAWGTGEQKYQLHAQQLNGDANEDYWLADFAPAVEVTK